LTDTGKNQVRAQIPPNPIDAGLSSIQFANALTIVVCVRGRDSSDGFEMS